MSRGSSRSSGSSRSGDDLLHASTKKNASHDVPHAQTRTPQPCGSNVFSHVHVLLYYYYSPSEYTSINIRLASYQMDVKQKR